ncbi:hypothetical protein [Streptomyces lancefieldiae]|uniref:Integral membrane protein n=1 Tax=Streptomyces lancefieldiae TaxID=3075520 RepID=A0ABU3AVQ3_9ACTN|nr:hypothetical protein [Streptomyces sp. DSM 40712]MDT0614273.1 hypothetical protein [Streptomyces sp. DSM 40712]
MGWGRGPGAAGRRRLRWSNDEWNGAAALCAAQLPLVWLAWWFVAEAGHDDHGRGGGFLGIVCAPLILPLLGVLHASAQIMPGATLARLVAPRRRGPGWAWHAGASALVGAGWAVLGRVVWEDWSLPDTLPWFAGAGVLPVLGLTYLRGREWGRWSVWFRSAGACFVLFAVGGLGAAALADEYEPPALSAERLAGDWHGDHGAVLRLAPGGRAELTRVPAQPDLDATGDYTRCDGTGTWTRHPDGHGSGGRDGVLVRLDGDCGEETYWTIGGTGQEPELFALFGDPDAGELFVLDRD